MKKLQIIIVCILPLFLLTSCEKNYSKKFTGDYTFKTTGTITVEMEETSSVMDIELTNEIGQLDIMDVDEKDRVLVIKDVLNGDIYTAYAQVTDNAIGLDTISITRQLYIDTTLYLIEIKSAITGVMYGDKIIFNEVYSGDLIKDRSTATEVVGRIVDSDVSTVATRNKN
ncbi:MAG: hypothetical protein PHR20_06170 [Bacteroidales bacterium]|nr:hypothetical protein [Bacteroidales bacterium]